MARSGSTHSHKDKKTPLGKRAWRIHQEAWHRPTTAEFKRLQRKWYKKAAKPYKDQDGNRQQYKDIEYGYDLNKMATQTFRKSSNGVNQHGVVMLTDFERMEREGDYDALASYGWDGASGLGESDTYERFQRIGSYVHEMDDTDTAKRILQAVLDTGGNASKAARKLRLSKSEVQDVWNSALATLALPLGRSAATRMQQDPEPEPGPVRQLSQDEIAKLNYKTPKDIK